MDIFTAKSDIFSMFVRIYFVLMKILFFDCVIQTHINYIKYSKSKTA